MEGSRFLNGASIQISGDTQTDTPLRDIQLNVSTSLFKGGKALYGGAIHINLVKNLGMVLIGNNFTENQAILDGGALYLDDLNRYRIDMR